MIQLQEIKRYTENMNVLYVEDDEMIQSQMRTFLERVFLSVDIANNGIEGLELYKNKSYDLVISDIAMPHMNGIEMTKSMMKIKPEQQVVIISAHNEPDQLLELLNARIKYYALKPIEPSEQVNFQNFISKS